MATTVDMASGSKRQDSGGRLAGASELGSNRRTPGLARISAILEACAVAPRTFTALVAELGGISPSTLSRHLRLLAASDLVRRAKDGSYRLGPEAVALGLVLTGRGIIDRQAQEVVAALARETGESSAYFEWQVERLVLVAKHEVSERFHFLDLFDHGLVVAGMFGAVLLGAMSADEHEARLAAVRKLPAGRQERIRLQIGMVRRCGYATEEEHGVWRLGLPVRRRGQLAGVLAVARPGAPAAAQERRLVTAAESARRRLEGEPSQPIRTTR